MKWRMHGANPEKLYDQFNLRMPEKVIDYSDNGNAITRTKPFNIDYEALFDKYPDDEVLKLRRLISNRENIPIENILFGNGTNEFIYILASFYQKKTVAILHPTYSEYEKALNAYDVKVENIFDFAEITQKYDAVIICNPNNPTGRYFSHETILNLVKKLVTMNINLIIDEAYIDFMNNRHHFIDVTIYNNVYILRSLTKFFHMSGLRIGYIVSHQDNILKIKVKQPTWSVNSIAQEVGFVYLNDLEFIEKAKTFYEAERTRIFAELEKLGFEVMDSVVNFFVMKVKNDIELIKYLLTKGIVVRHTRNFPGLDGNYVRITIKSKVENDYLLETLRDYVMK